MLVRSTFSPQLVEKIEKLKLSLSKKRNKMLKIRSEMLKTRKKAKQSLSGKFFLRNFPNPGNLKEFRFGKKGNLVAGEIWKKVENLGKGETLVAGESYVVELLVALKQAVF